MSQLRLLVVEDDPAFSRLLEERLRDVTELRVVAFAETLASAIATAKEFEPGVDVALIDLALPDSEGIDTVRDFHAAAPRIPLIVLSGQRDVDVAIEAMRHGAQDYILKNTADALALVRAARLAIERKRLQDVEQMLVGVVSHDLRGPLQTVTLACDMLVESATGSQRPILERAKRAATRATNLVNDLLDATRARLAGILPLDLTSVDIGRVVEQVVEDYRQLHPERNIVLDLSGVTDTVADAKRLGQVVGNLLGNAIQHSPSGSKVSVTLRGADDAFSLEVHNGGRPIPVDLRHRLFEPLERAEAAKVDPSHSVGLGLFIVREIIRAHGGTIDVTSDEIGTKFSVRIPTGRTTAPTAFS